MIVKAVAKYWCECGNSMYPHKGIKKKYLGRHKRGHLRGYRPKIEMGEYCCNFMKEAIDDEYIVFGEYGEYMSKDLNLNIIHCSPYPEGAVFTECPIEYCPFCADKIIVRIVDETN